VLNLDAQCGFLPDLPLNRLLERLSPTHKAAGKLPVVLIAKAAAKQQDLVAVVKRDCSDADRERRLCEMQDALTDG
jgi:hypothetical protein